MKLRYVLLILVILAPWLLSDCILIGGSEEYKATLATGMENAAGPDVAYVDSMDMAGYVDKGWLKSVPDKFDVTDFYEATLAPFRWQERLYAVPHDTQTVALIVNQDILDMEGLVPPQDWGGFENIAYALCGPDGGVYGLGLTTGIWSFLPFLYQGGGSLVDEQGQRLTINTEQAVAALEFYAGPSRAGCARVVTGPGFEQGAFNGLLEDFAAGHIAMFLGWPGMYYQALQLMNLDPAVQTTVQVYELPAGPEGRQATIAFTRALGFFGQADKTPSPGAVEFVRYATGREGLAFWFGDQGTPPGYIPARVSLAGSWLRTHPDTTAFVAGLGYAVDFKPDGVPREALEALFELTTRVFPDVLSGEGTWKDIGSALQYLEHEGNAILAPYR